MRRRALVTTGAIALTIGSIGAAQAWVSGGAIGEGKARVISARDVQDVDVSGDVPRDLVPGKPAAVIGAFDNPNRFPVEVRGVHIEIVDILGAAGPCAATDFAVEDAAEPTAKATRWIVQGEDTRSWKGGSITLLNDETHSPDGCLGATVKLGFTATR